MKHRVWWCRNVDNQLRNDQKISLVVLVVLFESYFSHFSESPWFTNQYSSRFMSLNCLAAAVGPWVCWVNQNESYRKWFGGPLQPFLCAAEIGLCSFFFLPTHWIIEFCLSPSNLKTLKEPKGLQKTLSWIRLRCGFCFYHGKSPLSYDLRNIFYFFQAAKKQIQVVNKKVNFVR